MRDTPEICNDVDHDFVIEEIDGIYAAGDSIGFTNRVEICKHCRLIRDFLPMEKIHTFHDEADDF